MTNTSQYEPLRRRRPVLSICRWLLMIVVVVNATTSKKFLLVSSFIPSSSLVDCYRGTWYYHNSHYQNTNTRILQNRCKHSSSPLTILSRLSLKKVYLSDEVDDKNNFCLTIGANCTLTTDLLRFPKSLLVSGFVQVKTLECIGGGGEEEKGSTTSSTETHVKIGKEGTLYANIKDGSLCNMTVEVYGTLYGNIDCNRLVVGNEGIIIGDVVTRELDITPGGSIQGVVLCGEKPKLNSNDSRVVYKSSMDTTSIEGSPKKSLEMEDVVVLLQDPLTDGTAISPVETHQVAMENLSRSFDDTRTLNGINSDNSFDDTRNLQQVQEALTPEQVAINNLKQNFDDTRHLRTDTHQATIHNLKQNFDDTRTLNQGQKPYQQRNNIGGGFNNNVYQSGGGSNSQQQQQQPPTFNSSSGPYVDAAVMRQRNYEEEVESLNRNRDLVAQTRALLDNAAKKKIKEQAKKVPVPLKKSDSGRSNNNNNNNNNNNSNNNSNEKDKSATSRRTGPLSAHQRQVTLESIAAKYNPGGSTESIRQKLPLDDESSSQVDDNLSRPHNNDNVSIGDAMKNLDEDASESDSVSDAHERSRMWGIDMSKYT